MDSHHVADFLTKALRNVRAPFRQHQGSAQRGTSGSEPSSGTGNSLAHPHDISVRADAPDDKSHFQPSTYQHNRIARYQREITTLKAANRKLRHQLTQQELEERRKTENLRILQVLAINELESQLRDRVPMQTGSYINSELGQSPKYTAGSQRILMASDGFEHCLALFLTEKLVDSMLEVIKESRELELLEGPYDIARREVEIGEANVKFAKAMIEKGGTQEHLECYHVALREHESRLVQDVPHKNRLERDFRLKEIKVKYLHAGLRGMLKQALEEARLIPEAKEADHDPTQNFLDAPSDRTQSDVAIEDGEPLPDPEEEERRLVEEEMEAARIELDAAQEHFYTIRHRQQNEVQDFRNRGGEAAFEFLESDLDLEHVKQQYQATGELIQAEEALDLVRERARALGIIGNLRYQRSRFIDMEEDGHIESEDPSLQPTVDVDSIRAWAEDICGDQDLEDMDAEVDDWEVKTVIFGNSLSVVAEDPCDRKYLNCWQSACNRAAEGEMDGDPSAVLLHDTRWLQVDHLYNYDQELLEV